MSTLLKRCSLLFVIALLVLGPAWCRGLCLPRQVEPEANKTHCCQTTFNQSDSLPIKTPAKSSLTCCCSRAAIIPEKVTHEFSGSGFLLLTNASDAIANCDSIASHIADWQPLFFGPPKNILHCVWRC